MKESAGDCFVFCRVSVRKSNHGGSRWQRRPHLGRLTRKWQSYVMRPQIQYLVKFPSTTFGKAKLHCQNTTKLPVVNFISILLRTYIVSATNLVSFSIWKFVLVILMQGDMEDFAHVQLISMVLPTQISKHKNSLELNVTRLMISIQRNARNCSSKMTWIVLKCCEYDVINVSCVIHRNESVYYASHKL